MHWITVGFEICIGVALASAAIGVIIWFFIGFVALLFRHTIACILGVAFIVACILAIVGNPGPLAVVALIAGCYGLIS
jgi:hypothetical protein